MPLPLNLAPTLAARSRGGGGLGTDAECDGALLPELFRTNAAGQIMAQGELAAALTTATDACYQILLEPVCVTGQITHALTSEGADASEDGTGRGTPLVAFGGNNTSGAIEVAPALLRAAQRQDFETETFVVGPAPLALAFSENTRGEVRLEGGVVALLAVRRLMPSECEALQGFPRDHTRIPYRRKPAADAPRYRALGNSMAVPCMRWLGERLHAADTTARSAITPLLSDNNGYLYG